MVDSYKLRRLMPAELLAADDHIAICKCCRERLYVATGLKGAASLLRQELNSLPEIIPRHAGYQQLADYLDRRLDESDQEVLKAHLTSCFHCAADILDLIAFKRVLESESPTLELK